MSDLNSNQIYENKELFDYIKAEYIEDNYADTLIKLLKRGRYNPVQFSFYIYNVINIIYADASLEQTYDILNPEISFEQYLETYYTWKKDLLYKPDLIIDNNSVFQDFTNIYLNNNRNIKNAFNEIKNIQFFKNSKYTSFLVYYCLSNTYNVNIYDLYRLSGTTLTFEQYEREYELWLEPFNKLAQEIPFTENDTEDIIIAKNAFSLNIPIQYLYFTEGEYISLPILIKDLITTQSLYDIISIIVNLETKLQLKDIFILIYNTFLDYINDQIAQNYNPENALAIFRSNVKYTDFVAFYVFEQLETAEIKDPFTFIQTETKNRYTDLEEFLWLKNHKIFALFERFAEGSVLEDVFIDKDFILQQIPEIDNARELISQTHHKFPTLSIEEVIFLISDLDDNFFQEIPKEYEKWEDYKTFETQKRNSLYYLNTVNKFFSTYNDFSNYLEDTNVKNSTDIQAVIQKLTNIQKVQNFLNHYDLLSFSTFNIISKYIRINPLYENNIPTIYDGLEIFDNCIPDSNISLIVYLNNFGVKYYKVYTGNIYNKVYIADSADMNYLNQYNVNMKENNSIYFVNWYDEKDKINKGSYKLIQFDLNKNRIFLDLDNEYEKSIKKNFQKVCNNLNLNFESEYIINTDFSVYFYGIELDYASFTDFISTNKIMKEYFYLKETNTISAKKDFYKLYYRRTDNSENINIVLKQENPDENMIYYNSNGTTETRKNQKIIKVTIQKVRNEMKSFVLILSKMLAYYNSIKTDIEQFYDRFLFLGISDLSRRSSVNSETSEVSTTSVLSNISILSEGKEIRKQAILKNFHPFFGSGGYARSCQSSARVQPTIVPQDQINDWTSRTFYDRRGEHNRQVLEFTLKATDNLPEQKIFFGCDNPEANYPYYKPNNGVNNKIYPVVPCCGKTESKAKSELDKLQELKGKEQKTTILSKDHGSIKVGSEGYIPGFLLNFLRRYNGKDETFIRYGIIEGINSLVHAALYAVNDTRYNDTRTSTENKEHLANIYRNEMIHTLNLSVCKQECYDKTEFEIKNELVNRATLDPLLHYRLIEERFNLNVFIFDESGILIPRNKTVHLHRFVAERKCLLIFRTLNPFQCCIIVSGKNRLFPLEMNTLLYTALTNVSVNLELNYTGFYKNFHNLALDGLRNLNPELKLDSQLIDVDGKLRVVNAMYNSLIFQICVPSTQPLNLKIDTYKNILTLEQLNSIILQLPTAATYKDNLCTGFWYSLYDYKYCYYIEIVPIELKNPIPAGPICPYFTEIKSNDLDEYRMLERTMILIFGLIKWCYTLSKVYNNFNLTEFSKLFFVQDIKYDITNIRSKLKNVNHITDALKLVQTYTNGTLSDGKNLIIKSELLKQKIVRKLSIFDTQTEGLIYNIPENSEIIKSYSSYQILNVSEYLEGYYRNEWDFKKYKNVSLFMSTEQYDNWLNREAFKIYTILEDFKFKTPFLLKDEKEYLYLVQNCNSLQTALQISTYFKENGSNIGFNGTGNLVEEDNYILFSIQNYKLSTTQKVGNWKKGSLILKYNNGMYASIMNI